MQEKYRVILYCKQSNEELIEQLKRGVLRRLNLTREAQAKLFGAQPIVAAREISKAEALKCKKAIEAVGGVCEIEPVSTFRQIDDAGFVERRLMWRRSDEERRSDKREMSTDRRKRDRRRS